MFIRKSIKLGKHTRVNVTKNGLSSITIGGKHSRLGIRKDGSTYASANKNGYYVKQELSKGNKTNKRNVKTKNITNTQQPNNDVTLVQMLKMCTVLFFIVMIIDGLTIKSGLLLKIFAVLDIAFFIISGIGIVAEDIKKNKKDLE